jgi:autotransporter-associated beta strand protein
VVLSGANDLSGLMEINAGSLVIADAGLLTRGALTVSGDWGGAGSGRNVLRACLRSDWRQAPCRVGV